MKKYLTILAALMLLNTTSAFAQTTGKTADSTAVKCGETVTITATPDAGYEFDQWQDGNKDNPRDITIDENTNLWEYTASFKAKTYTILVAVKTAGTGSVEKDTIYGNLGDKVKLKAIESETCYQFKEWQDASGTTLSTDHEYEYTIADNATVYAVFAEKEFTVKVTSPVTGGKVTIAKKQP